MVEITWVDRDVARPSFTIDVLSDPIGETRAGESDTAAAESRLVQRSWHLRRPFESDADVLVTIGQEAVNWNAALHRFATESANGRLFCTPPTSSAVFGVKQSTASDPAAVIALLGLDAGVPEQPDPIALVRELATTVGRTAPIYVIGVTSLDLLSADPDAEAVIDRCRDLRMALVVHRNAQRRDIVTLAGTDMLRPGCDVAPISLISPPTFRAGEGTPGMARLQLSLWKGEAEIAFRYDLGSDNTGVATAQVVRPLVSASRITAAERRLRTAVGRLLDGAGAGTEEFADYVDRVWSASGYVPLSGPEGGLPDLPIARRLPYNLLLLLRERDDGGHDLLLSHHTPLTEPSLASWSALLLPAFTNVRLLLEHLRDDVMRQAIEQANDTARAVRAQQFEEAVEEILDNDGHEQDRVWEDQLREIETRKIRKISPSTGTVTEYEYRLVTLIPLVDRRIAEDDERVGRIVHWLRGIERIGAHENHACRVSMTAIGGDGAGLRWDPEVELLDTPDRSQRARAEKVRAGTVWFPLGDDGKPRWKECPALQARNADVMTWIDEILDKLRLPTGAYPPELVLQKAAADIFEPVEAYPFASNGRRRPDGKAASTVDALRDVTYDEDSDLTGSAYPDAVIRPVFLVRQELAVVAGAAPRGAILVIDAAAHVGGRRYDPEDPEVLGFLRPVQRYVVTAGLLRVQELEDSVLEPARKDGWDPWGFLRVRKGAAPALVSLTPPIVEALHPVDYDDERSTRDFVVCDGNHRIVQFAWRSGVALQAVAITSRPREPYYARPFGRLEWDITAGNEYVVAPDVKSKYSPRPVERTSLPEAARAKLARVDDELLYRRFYRDLSSGFGSVGGQGGAF